MSRDTPAGELRSIRKVYGTVTAVDEVSLHVYPGEVLVVVGPNGSGKTTSMEILSGLRSPDSGEARISGDIVSGTFDARLRTGVQLQDSRLPGGLKVREAIHAKSALYVDPGPIDVIVDSMGLRSYLGTSVDKLSGGLQRRLDVAVACIGRPSLLILDEPTSGIDPDARGDMWHFFREVCSAGTAIITSTHDLSEVEAFADRMIVMTQGRVEAEGTVSEILAGAGGTWRLRVSRPDEEVRRMLTDSELETRERASTVTVFGEREQITAIADRLESMKHSGEGRYRDLLKGAIRLEDVFTSMTESGHDG
ncbi:hypothetical protein LP52_00615 [Streptomonospora alba]|uniref:ABC transporter domain-containing protein n=2 Tax=Streptomonospora alba TaxID=183763 RepID=A0A0C2JHG8_9ACTN|nr:hypothetical protein LP52_00615 [Streptomonospora alba]